MAFVISESSPITYPGPPPHSADVVVIGGGIIGVCTALQLAKAGQKVVLCEKGRIAGEQSSRNWGWIRQTGRDPDELPIVSEANRLWQEHANETNIDIGLRQVGISYLATSETEYARIQDWLVHAKAHGVDSRMLSKRETAAITPDFSRSFVGALHTASDLRAEPWVAVPALAGIAVRSGATLVENCAVRVLETANGAITGVVTEQGTISTNRVVVAGGAWSSLFLRRHGVDIPQLSVRASACMTQKLPDIGETCASDGTVAWRRRDDGAYTLAAGGFHELFIGPDALRAFPSYWEQLKADPFGRRYLGKAPKGYPDAWGTPRRWSGEDVSPFEKMRVLDPAPNMKKLRSLAQSFAELFPSIGPVRIEKSWGGMIDTMPDEIPVIDEAPDITGLFIGTGFSGHGFGIGPGMGRVLADLAMGRDPGHDLSRFRIGRFADGSMLTPAQAGAL